MKKRRTPYERIKSLAPPTNVVVVVMMNITVTVTSLFKLLCNGFGLGPVEEFLLLGCLVIYGEYNLARFTNFETVGKNGLIGGSNFPALVYYDSVSILSAGHKFSSIADIPTHHSDFPNKMAFLQQQKKKRLIGTKQLCHECTDV